MAKEIRCITLYWFIDFTIALQHSVFYIIFISDSFNRCSLMRLSSVIYKTMGDVLILITLYNQKSRGLYI